MSGGNRDRPSHGSVDERIARLAAARHGVFSYADAVRLGADKHLIRRRLAARRWERLLPRVYRLRGAPGSWRQRLLAACLAAGPGSAASHRAAAPLWRLVGFEPAGPELTLPRERRPRLPPEIIVHRAALPPVDVVTVDAIPVTSPARTILDLASVCPVEAVEEALDDALRRGLLSPARLRRRLADLGRRPGAALARRLLDARSGEIPESVLETRLLRLIRRAGLPEPACQHEIPLRDGAIARVDFAYPDRRLAIEVDGYRWHSSRIRWQSDLGRRNALTRLGWRVLHVTADDLHRRADRTAREIAEALRRPGPRDRDGGDPPPRDHHGGPRGPGAGG